MTRCFDNIEYLRHGTSRQQQTYEVLTANHIMIALKEFDPLLVGTIPIDIAIEGSDLDIICHCKDIAHFANVIKENFSHHTGFAIRQVIKQGHKAVISIFAVNDFEIEIFGQDMPVRSQYAYRHMMIEHKLLLANGESFRQGILQLKRQGYKTEPAFAKLLNLKGDPYTTLLAYEDQ